MTIHVPPLDCEWSDPISASLQRHPIADLTAPARFARYRRIDRIYAEFPRVDEDRGICRRQLRGANQASVSHFARLFKLSTGVTAMSFVEQCRVRRAQTLIHDRDLPLVEVALITGFSDQAISRDAIVYTPAARLPLLRVSMGAGVPHSGSTTRPRWSTRWRHQSIL